MLKKDEIKEQTQIQDFSEPTSNADEMRRYMENYNRNEVRIAGSVRDIFITEPKPKMKKELVDGAEIKVPKLNEQGEPEFYEASAYVTVAFDGGEMQLNLKASVITDLVIGRRYMFDGVKGMNYGSVQDKFHSITLL